MSAEIPRKQTPLPSSQDARRRMVAQRRAGTKPELLLRSALYRRGLRYRVDQLVLRGTRRRADIVFSKSRVAVEVRGCFWHACPTHGTIPRANRDWWQEKLRGNTARDADTERRMAAEGWQLIVVWEHEDVDAAADLIESAVRARIPTPRDPSSTTGQRSTIRLRDQVGRHAAGSEPAGQSTAWSWCPRADPGR